MEVRLDPQKLGEAPPAAENLAAVGALAGGIAHDFNNLLGIIEGNLDLVRPLVAAQAEASELVGEALQATLRAAGLMRRLVAILRGRPLAPQCVAVNGLVAAMARLLRRAPGGGIAIDLRLHGDAGAVLADPAELEAALVNLVLNAREAMPAGGTIAISTGTCRSAERDWVVIAVSDTGMGMAPGVAGQIFEPFFTTNPHGAGLGLKTIADFLKRAGGEAKVSSVPGQGTIFRLYLPRLAEAAWPPS